MVSETEESVSKWEWLAAMNSIKRASKNRMKRYCWICMGMAVSVVWGRRNQKARLHDDRFIRERTIGDLRERKG